MTSRWMTLVLLLALAGGLYFLGTAADRTIEPPPEGGLLFPGFEVGDVDYISLKFRTGEVLDVERDAGGPWRITFPTDEFAQQEYIERLVDDLARATFLPVEEQGEIVNPADVGLEPQQLTLSFRSAGQLYTLYVGERDVFGQGVYVRRADSQHIVKTSPGIRTWFDSFRAQDYIDIHLLRGLRGAVDSVRIEEGERVVIDAVRSGDSWIISEPVTALGDGSRIVQLIRSLQQAELLYPTVIDPLDSKLAELKLPNASQVAANDWAGATMIRLGSGAEKPARMFLEQGWKLRDAETLAIRDDLKKVLVFERQQINLALNEVDFFRERRVLPPIQARAKSVRITVGDVVQLDIRSGERGSWTFHAPEHLAGVGVDSLRLDGRSVLSDFLGRFDSLHVESFADAPHGAPDGAPDGPAAAELRVVWTAAGRDRIDTVSLHDLAAPSIPATTSHRPGEGLLLDASVVRELLDPQLADDLRDLSPVDVDATRWAGLAIHLPDVEVPLTIERSADGSGPSWTGDDAWGRRFGLGQNVLRKLRGSGWQAAPQGAVYPWRLVFTGVGGELLGTLEMRRPGPDDPSEALGQPVVIALWSQVPGRELLLPRFWLDDTEELTRPLKRD